MKFAHNELCFCEEIFESLLCPSDETRLITFTVRFLIERILFIPSSAKHLLKDNVAEIRVCNHNAQHKYNFIDIFQKNFVACTTGKANKRAL